MSLIVVALDQYENFIQFLDDDNLKISESEEKGGLKSLDLEYAIQEDDSPNLFDMGNKIWVQKGNGKDCLYVIQSPVELSYDEKRYVFSVEEVLVELNYAPYISQTDITSKNGFSISTVNNEQNVLVNYAALNFWFGNYFTIGIVQDCLSTYLQRIVVEGTMSLMSLLRYIEEETSNFFRTRYEKDTITNVIHRYLDFLNPSDVNRDWELNIDVDLPNDTSVNGDFTSNGTSSTDETPEEEDDTIDEYQVPVRYSPNLDVSFDNISMRLLDDQDNLIIDNDGDEINFSSEDMGLNQFSSDCSLCIKYVNQALQISVNGKTYATLTEDEHVGDYGIGFSSIANNVNLSKNVVLHNNSKLQLIEGNTGKVFYQQIISPVLGEVHEDILDVGYNVENISLEVDESDTYTAIAPVLTNDGSSDGLTRSQMNTRINNWKNLQVNKGDKIPMIVQKITTEGKISGTSDPASKYFSRPLKPNDNTSSSPATYEYWVGTAYWKAPFTKNAGELFIQDESITHVLYQNIHGKQDVADGRPISTPKCGPVETSDEDKYAIYNDVAMKLKEKRYPQVTVSIDVSNYRDEQYNNYNVHDKLYIKIPNFSDIITAVVTKTEKNPHDPSKNSVELGNYSVNAKIAPKETIITGENLSFTYPKKGTLVLTLADETDAPLKGKLITCSLYKVQDGNATLTRTTYNKTTNANGQISLTLGYDPGNYEIEANFGGDEEFESSTSTFKINVAGKKVVTTKKVTTTKIDAKAKKTTKKKKVKKLYWTKYGVNPDGNQIFAIGLPTHSDELKTYGKKYRGNIFSRKCPVCGSTKLFWGWKFGTYFRNLRVDSAHSKEGMIYCEKCESTFSIFGNQNGVSKPKKLKLIKEGSSSEKDAKTLKSGKYVYESITITNKKKKVNNKKERTVKNKNIHKTVKNKALKIVDDSVGLAAAKKIVHWVGSHIKYEGRNNFYQSPKTTLARRRGNCCCQMELALHMMDAAGCTEYFNFVWCHTHGSKGGHVFGRLITKSTGKYRYVDPTHSPYWATCLSGAKYGYAPGTLSSAYPSRPF